MDPSGSRAPRVEEEAVDPSLSRAPRVEECTSKGSGKSSTGPWIHASKPFRMPTKPLRPPRKNQPQSAPSPGACPLPTKPWGAKKKASGQMSIINAFSDRKRNRRFRTSTRHFVSGSRNALDYRRKRSRLQKETQHCGIRNAIFLAWSHSNHVLPQQDSFDRS